MMWLLSIPALLCFLLLILWLSSFKDDVNKSAVFTSNPKVSVLVAARNEAHNIIECLEALDHLSYSNVEIIIGNDHSEDDTLHLIQNYIDGKSKFKVVDITTVIEGTRGKSNVLAQLARIAQGEFLFVTDADTTVPEKWIESMLSGFDEKTGIVTGMTSISPKGLFDRLQQIDWLYALHLVKVVSDFKMPVTSMGNNMAFRKDAYEQTGGYENLPFSITEDFQLFKEILKRGWGFTNLFNQNVLAYSKPVTGVGTLLHQRKRWMIGAVQVPWYFLIVLLVQALFYPIMVLLSIMAVPGVLWVLAVKVFVQGLFILRAYHRLSIRLNWFNVILFEIYSTILSLSLILFFILPISVNWKGRKY